MAALGRQVKLCARFRQVLLAAGQRVGQTTTRNIRTGKLDDKDLQLFLRKDVQQLLKRITEFDSEALFGEKISDISRRPTYKLLSDEELKDEMQHARGMMEERLQMPPMMKERAKRTEVLAKNPEIAPVIKSKYVFIDISQKENYLSEPNEAVVVCRHPDGSLHWADWNVIDRVLQVYRPRPGRHINMPRMFEQEQLEKILISDNYQYILEAACAQFEPDSGDFLRVTRRIYEHVFSNRAFHMLRSTRFFGPMAFYLAKMNKIEPLMIYMLEIDRSSDAVDLINLKCIMSQQPQMTGPNLAIISNYMKTKAHPDYKKELTEAVQSYMTNTSTKAKQNS